MTIPVPSFVMLDDVNGAGSLNVIHGTMAQHGLCWQFMVMTTKGCQFVWLDEQAIARLVDYLSANGYIRHVTA